MSIRYSESYKNIEEFIQDNPEIECVIHVLRSEKPPKIELEQTQHTLRLRIRSFIDFKSLVDAITREINTKINRGFLISQFFRISVKDLSDMSLDLDKIEPWMRHGTEECPFLCDAISCRAFLEKIYKENSSDTKLNLYPLRFSKKGVEKIKDCTIVTGEEMQVIDDRTAEKRQYNKKDKKTEIEHPQDQTAKQPNTTIEFLNFKQRTKGSTGGYGITDDLTISQKKETQEEIFFDRNHKFINPGFVTDTNKLCSQERGNIVKIEVKKTTPNISPEEMIEKTNTSGYLKYIHSKIEIDRELVEGNNNYKRVLRCMRKLQEIKEQSPDDDTEFTNYNAIRYTEDPELDEYCQKETAENTFMKTYKNLGGAIKDEYYLTQVKRKESIKEINNNNKKDSVSGLTNYFRNQFMKSDSMERKDITSSSNSEIYEDTYNVVKENYSDRSLEDIEMDILLKSPVGRLFSNKAIESWALKIKKKMHFSIIIPPVDYPIPDVLPYYETQEQISYRKLLFNLRQQQKKLLAIENGNTKLEDRYKTGTDKCRRCLCTCGGCTSSSCPCGAPEKEKHYTTTNNTTTVTTTNNIDIINNNITTFNPDALFDSQKLIQKSAGDFSTTSSYNNLGILHITPPGLNGNIENNNTDNTTSKKDVTNNNNNSNQRKTSLYCKCSCDKCPFSENNLHSLRFNAKENVTRNIAVPSYLVPYCLKFLGVLAFKRDYSGVINKIVSEKVQKNEYHANDEKISNCAIIPGYDITNTKQVKRIISNAYTDEKNKQAFTKALGSYEKYLEELEKQKPKFSITGEDVIMTNNTNKVNNNQESE